MSRTRSAAEKDAQAVVKGVRKKGGEFIRSGDSVQILLGGRRIVVSPDFDNTAYAEIQIEHSGKGTAESNGRAICQHVAVLGSKGVSSVRLAKFSTGAKDKSRLYVPVKGSLLQISAGGIRKVPNGTDSIWLEHPLDAPFEFLPDCNVGEALRDFERLCVETQACAVPSHKWLVAMHEGLLPYVRDFLATRMLVEHSGPSQRGKTSGAQRFTKLHGLGEVLGDVSTAYLRNNCDGMGLMVLDNKEQANYNPDLISLLLFSATGARHGRSTQDGSAREMSDRPIVVLTSIEGLYKQELQKRRISINYGAFQPAHADRDHIEDQIERRRNVMLSGLCHVLRQFMITEDEQVHERLRELPPNPWPEFQSYVRVLAKLLYAYGSVTGRCPEWADEILSNVFETTASHSGTREEDVIETHVNQMLLLYEAVLEKHENCGELSPMNALLLRAIQRIPNYEHGRQTGTLFVTTASDLRSSMVSNNIGSKDLPRNASGMGKRLESGGWINLKVLREEDDPVLLRRTSIRRPIGIFRASENHEKEVLRADCSAV